MQKTILAGGLLAPPCLQKESLLAVGRNLTDVTEERRLVKALSSRGSELTDILETKLTQRETEWTNCFARRTEMLRCREELLPLAEKQQERKRILIEEQEELRAAQADAEEKNQQHMDAQQEQLLAEDSEQRARTRLGELRQLHKEKVRDQEEAPAKVEELLRKVQQCEERRADLVRSDQHFQSVRDDVTRRRQLLNASMKEAVQSKENVGKVITELKDVEQQRREDSLDNPHALADDVDLATLEELEQKLCRVRPSRLNTIPAWCESPVVELELLSGRQQEDELPLSVIACEFYRLSGGVWQRQGEGEALLLKHQTSQSVRFAFLDNSGEVFVNILVIRVGPYYRLRPGCGSVRVDMDKPSDKWVWFAVENKHEGAQRFSAE
jgi:hypothetical protein